MGKRKKKQVLVDPILPEKLKRVKINPEGEKPQSKEIEEQDNSDEFDSQLLEEEENLEGQEGEEEEEEKTNYEKFLENLNLRQNKNLIDTETKKILKNLNKIEIVTDKAPEIDPYQEHFSFPHANFLEKGIVDEKVIVKHKKKTGKQQLREKMMEIFDLKYKEKEKKTEKTDQQIEEDVHKVKINDFALKPEFKKKSTQYQFENYQQFILNKSSEQHFSKEINAHLDSHIYEKIKPEIPKIPQANTKSDKKNPVNYLPYTFFKNYVDFTYIDPEENNCLNFRKQYITHILNHVVKGNKTVFTEEQEQNQQEKDTEKKEKLQKDNGGNNNEEDEGPKEQNKGFTRCKVLILTPYKGDASVIVQELISQFTQKEGLTKTSFKQRFEEYYNDPEKFMEDDFRLGISLTKSKSVKLFSSFDHSDIIVSSPLGLRLKIGASGEKDREYSFLSSVECLILDRASTLYMQNFNHVEEILEIMNRIPRHKSMNYGIDEIRPYFFENYSKFYRQSIIYTECNFPELNSIRNKYFSNYKGQIVNKPFYPPLFTESELLFNQEFNKIEIQNYQNELEERFQIFKTRVWENWRNIDNTVIFCSSYFEYLKLKDYFVKINGSFQGICEYTKKSRIQSRVSMWKQKQFRTILFSERTQYFDLWDLRNQQNILFYSLPKTASIYKRLLENIEKPNPKTKIQCLFTQYDALQLEKIVGTNNAKEFLAEYNKNTSFII